MSATVIVRVWEWDVTQAGHNRPVGVCMSRDGAMAALAWALVAAGQPGRGSVRPMDLVNEVHSDAHYLRLPVARTAIYDQGRIRWERPPWTERQQSHSSVTQRGGKALCGV